MDENTQIINAFPGYMYRNGHNIYMGEDVGRGGYVYSEPGIYSNVALIDVASMHPHSIIAMNCFGEHTKRFEEIVNARVAIKHGDIDKAKTLLDGALIPYLNNPDVFEALAYALKIAINAVYGLTAASFDNPFRDIRNTNNIVALRGALFMVTLKHEVQNRGFTVIHIKTDSIKIANASSDIIAFCMEFAKKYGYTFEHEATYDRICLIDRAQYIAKYSNDISINGKHSGEWTATGKEFQVPYVYKKLFTHEEIEFKDMCETKEVQTALYLDYNESLTPFDPVLAKELDKIDTVVKDVVKVSQTIGIDVLCQDALTQFDIFRRNPELRPPEVTDDDVKSIERFYKLCDAYGYIRRIGERYLYLLREEAKSHDYRFVGKVGLFCPIKPGKRGANLVRKADNNAGLIFEEETNSFKIGQVTKYDSVAGAKDYRWLDAEDVRGNEHWKDLVDISYYDKLVSEAEELIRKYDSPEWFCSSPEPYESLPFDV